MATLGLGLAAAAIGAQAGGGAVAFGLTAAQIGFAVGSAAGAVIDQAFVIPALFGQDQNSRGPRLDDLDASVASEGSSMHLVFGEQNRVGGTIIWMSDLIETVTETEVGGGKGGPSASQTTYSYSVNIAIAFGHAAGVGDGCLPYKIWADSKVIWELDTSHASWDGVLAKTHDGTLDDASWQALVTAAATEDARYTSIAVYSGASDQTANSLISSAEGAANTPAYRGITYCVITGLELADWGNRAPQFKANLANGAILISEIAFKLGELAGYTSANLDTSALYGCVPGYTISGPITTQKAIEPLLAYAEGGCRVDEGVVELFSLDIDAAITVPEDDIVGVAEFKMEDEVSLPSAVVVTHADTTRELQKGSQGIFRQSQPNKNLEVLEAPFSLTPTQARNFAQRRLFKAWQERRTARVTLMPEWSFKLQPGDILSVTFSSTGMTFLLRITTINRGANLACELDAIVTFSDLHETGIDTDANATDPGGPYNPGAIVQTIADIAPLLPEHAVQPLVYAGACFTDSTTSWKGATLYRVDSGGSLIENSQWPSEAVMGVVDADFAAPTAGATTWDRGTTITVTVYEGTLTSRTEQEVLRGENHALIGSEVIAFQTATLVAANQYELTGLLRGRRNTTAAAHLTNELFTLLDLRINPAVVNIGLKNESLTFKHVPSLATPGDYSGVTQTWTARTVTPWTVTGIAGERDGSNNLTVTWTRRTRIPTGLLTTPVVMDEPFEKYQITVTSGSAGRVETVEDVTTWSYTAAEQTTDGLTPGDDVDIEIVTLGQQANSLAASATV